MPSFVAVRYVSRRVLGRKMWCPHFSTSSWCSTTKASTSSLCCQMCWIGTREPWGRGGCASIRSASSGHQRTGAREGNGSLCQEPHPPCYGDFGYALFYWCTYIQTDHGIATAYQTVWCAYIVVHMHRLWFLHTSLTSACRDSL